MANGFQPTVPNSDIDALVDEILGNRAQFGDQVQVAQPFAQQNLTPVQQPVQQAPGVDALMAPQVPDGAGQFGGMSPAMLAGLAAQVPQLGGQIGRLVDTLSDERTKTDVRSAEDDIEHFLDALTRGR